jgi:hypothetical protein
VRGYQRRKEGEGHVGARSRRAEAEAQRARRTALQRVDAQEPQKLGARALQADEGVEANAAERGEAHRDWQLGAKLGQKVGQHLFKACGDIESSAFKEG